MTTEAPTMSNIGPIELIMLVLLYLLFCALVGRFASNRGRSAGMWFLVALLISPLIALLIVLVMGEGDRAPIVGAADEIAKLAALRDSGAITPEEYEGQKQALLAAGRGRPG
jgi:mannose/fructose/N-acetylgalactosamine-specific phosphotransferase system component IIC